LEVGIGLVVDEGSTNGHGTKESVVEQGLPVLLDALGTRGEGLMVKLG
jgi:hypothetical protein